MDSLLYIGMVHSLFIMLFLISKPKKSRSELVVILWMIFLCLPMASNLFASPDGFNFAIPLLKEKLPYALTYGPLLFLYTIQVTGSNNWNKKQYFLHFSPFVAGSLYKMIFVPGWEFNPNLDPDNSVLGNILSSAILISTLGYSWVVLEKLKKHKAEVFEQFSSVSTEISLKWLKWLTFCLIASSFLPFVAIGLSLPELMHHRLFALLTFMFILSFFGLKQLQIFYVTPLAQPNSTPDKTLHPDLKLYMEHNTPDRQTTNDSAQEDSSPVPSGTQEKEVPFNKEKYQRSGLSEEKSKAILVRLEAHMAKEQPHLDINLTADKLALQLDIPRHYLTQIFSEQLDKNFYQFINEHRVNAVKELLRDPSQHAMPLVDVAHHCGFNSKSTFNKVFKSITGMTPSQYRKANN